MWGVSIPQKLCSGEKNGPENIEMIEAFALYLAKSKTFKKYSKLVPDDKVFDVESTVDNVFEVKQISRKNIVLMENMTRCFECMRIINKTYNALETLRNEAFDMFNEDHMHILESFWKEMKGCDRVISGLISTEWTQLGFQGSDPTTDFRSMGMLGLHQLNHFARKKPNVAQLILKEFTEPGRNFPFAVIGINLTRLVMTMFSQRRLHTYIIQRFGNLTVNASLAYLEGPSNDSDCLHYVISLVHDFYCTVYEEFYMVWVIRKPASIMAFTELYNEVEALMYDKYPPLAK